jgi:hypothetical protein
MLRFVLVYFRAFTENAGGYTQHGRDINSMTQRRFPPPWSVEEQRTKMRPPILTASSY